MPTRRQVLLKGAMALAGLAVSSGPAQTNGTTAQSPAGTDKTRTSLHQEVDFKAKAQRIYEILLDSKQFSAFTGLPAEISREAGGTFSMFGGRIVGRNIEVVPNQRIVQAWRESVWSPGAYSVVKFELREHGSNTTVVLDHTGFGEGDFEHLNPGWKMRYWDPLEKFLKESAER